MRDENQLHAAVVELVALKDAEIKYSTVQNWWPGDEDGKGGIYNFVTKRGDCRGATLLRSAGHRSRPAQPITWKYPSCILRGDDSVGEFYSIAVTNGRQQADTGTKMIHLGKRTKLADHFQGYFSRQIRQHLSRPRQRINKNAPRRPRNFTQCDSLLIGGSLRRPYRALCRKPPHADAQLEHEATTTKLSEDQLFYARQRGLGEEEAVASDCQRLRARRCCRSCRWNSPSRRRSWSVVSLEGSVG